MCDQAEKAMPMVVVQKKSETGRKKTVWTGRTEDDGGRKEMQKFVRGYSANQSAVAIPLQGWLK